MDNSHPSWGAAHAGGSNHRDSGILSDSSRQRSRRDVPFTPPQGGASLHARVPAQVKQSPALSLRPPSGRNTSTWGGRTGTSKVWGPVAHSSAAGDTNASGSWRKILRVGGLRSAVSYKGGDILGKGATPPSDPLVSDGDGDRGRSTAGDADFSGSWRKILRTGGLSSGEGVKWGGPIRVNAPSPSDPAAVGCDSRVVTSLDTAGSAGTTGGAGCVPSFGNGDRAFFVALAGSSGSSAVPGRSHDIVEASPAIGKASVSE